MKILHVYGGNLYGGVERTLALFAASSADMPGLRQEFCLVYAGRLSQELQQAGATVHWAGPARISRPWQVSRARRRLAEVLRAGRFDAVLFHAWWPYGIFGEAARRCRVPAVLWVHDAIRRAGWLEYWATRHAPELVIANSRYTAETLRPWFPATPIEVFYTPARLDSPANESTRRETRLGFQTGGEACVIAQISRLEEWKGQEAHLRALAGLSDLPHWVCWMSAWPQRPHERRFLRKLQARALQSGIADRVRWLPRIDNVANVLRAADIFCQPNSKPEPFGTVLVEALLAGLPVVTTALGGALEIVTADCGILTPAGPDALRAALRRLIETPEERLRLAAGGPARGRELCDPHTQMQKLAALLQRLPKPASAARQS